MTSDWDRGALRGTDPPPVSNLERAALDGDEFRGNWCVRCGLARALFNLPTGRLVAVCPECVADRIDRVESEGHELPESLRILRTDGIHEAAYQKRRDESLFEAPSLVLYKCARCSRMVTEENARYHFPPGATSSPPYCESCWLVLSGQQPEKGEPETLQYASWRDLMEGDPTVLAFWDADRLDLGRVGIRPRAELRAVAAYGLARLRREVLRLDKTDVHTGVPLRPDSILTVLGGLPIDTPVKRGARFLRPRVVCARKPLRPFWRQAKIGD